MKILIACESSGQVRGAFAALGWDAWSCDLLPTEKPGNHLECNVGKILDKNWDMMIAHPPCTYLSSSGLHWTTRGLRDPKLTEDALDFVRLLMDAPIKRIAIENPVGCISTRIRPFDQIIQPWQFGHPESKTTCLWLKNLPLLRPTNVLPKPASGRWENQTPSGQNKLGPSADRWKLRAKTYTGIARAMAEQWSAFVSGSPASAPPVSAAVNRGVQLTMTIMPTAPVSAQATPKMTAGNLSKKTECSMRFVNVEPDPYILLMALSQTRGGSSKGNFTKSVRQAERQPTNPTGEIE